MSLVRTRPSFAIGFVEVVDEAVTTEESSASLARSRLLRWLSDRRSPLIFLSVRRSGGVPDALLFTLSGRCNSGVRSRPVAEIFETDL